MPTLVLMENVDDESDEMCKHVIFDKANHKVTKNPVIKS